MSARFRINATGSKARAFKSFGDAIKHYCAEVHHLNDRNVVVFSNSGKTSVNITKAFVEFFDMIEALPRCNDMQCGCANHKDT